MKPATKSYNNFFIFLFLIIFLEVHAADKKYVIIAGDNAKIRLAGEENGRKKYITELTGNPVIRIDNRELRTEKIIDNGETAVALGNVVLIDKLKGSRIKSAKAVFNREKNIVEFHGKPNAAVKREDDNSVVKIQADIIKYDIEKDTAAADGKVSLINNDVNINSDKAEFNNNAKTVIFSGNPEITRGDEVYNSDEVIYYTEKKLFILNKNAHASFYSEEKDKETKKVIKERIYAKGDRIEHYDAGERITVIKGNAEFEREDSIYTGDMFELKGEDSSQEITGLNVYFNNKKENTEAKGKYFKWYKKDGYWALWERACIIFKDQKTGKENQRVFGDFMEYYKDIDELYISGKVRIMREDGEIKGDMAKYRRQNNILRVFGNTRIETEKSVVMTHEILFNTKSNETMLHGDIKGRSVR